MNTSPSPVTVFKGMKLGTVATTREQDFGSIHARLCSSRRTAPQNPLSLNNIATLDLTEQECTQLLHLLTKFQGIFAPPTDHKGVHQL